MMTARAITSEDMNNAFRVSMRIFAASVCLVTARDEAGKFHGMAVTSSASLSMGPPSMLVAVNRGASIHPVVSQTGFFCINLMMQKHADLLEIFSRSDLRHQRFAGDRWLEGRDGLPVLKGALSALLCSVEESHDFGSHTVFFGRVNEIHVSRLAGPETSPIIWLDGSAKSVAL